MNIAASHLNSTDHCDANVVLLRGRVTSQPRIRELPSGSLVTQLEVTTRSGGVVASVPVAVFEATIDIRAADEVAVLGYVRRRFFRTGGITQSRTEVVATRVVSTARRRDVSRLMAAAAKLLDPPIRPTR